MKLSARYAEVGVERVRSVRTLNKLQSSIRTDLFHRLWEFWSCELSRLWDRTEAADSMATWKAFVIPLWLSVSPDPSFSLSSLPMSNGPL